MATFHSGVGGQVRIAEAEVPVTDWAASFRARLLDVTHAASGGLSEFVPGIATGHARMTLLWDSDQLPSGALNLVEGQELVCTLPCGGTEHEFAGTIVVETVNYVNAGRGTPLKVFLRGRFSGVFTRPQDL